MTINDVAENREALDTVERSLLADEREWLLRQLGSKAEGLRCWAFGLGWESRSVSEIPTSKVREFSEKYVSI
ncbi:MAG TPA: hypothetical protein VKU80_05035 [Planctomycetota bacterium]|nr:hypothetical protein [Planctomycetota bacterium]